MKLLNMRFAKRKLRSREAQDKNARSCRGAAYRSRAGLWSACALLLMLGYAWSCSRAQESPDALSRASLEDLTRMHISISSFARKEEDLWKTPAAVYVITREDIARSAATSIPELLRVVPGMQVAQIDASRWAVSARGFNSAYADKLLVLVDGRTVYSEIYSGVPWDTVDLPLEDIERIEVIRGPGAAMWGTNAVNGVVNIITRRAHSTLGGLVSGHVGRINDTIDLRYGGTLGDTAQYRGYANFVYREPLETATGASAYDGEKVLRGGGRVDWQKTWADWVTVTGDLYKGHVRESVLQEFAFPLGPNGADSGSIAGGHLLTRWEHKKSNNDTALQSYYDDQSRYQLASLFQTRTFDVDFQNHIQAGTRHDLVWGGEYRLTQDVIHSVVQTTTKDTYWNYLVDGFLQDEITLVPNRLVLTAGTKIQDGTLAGFQVQPSLRLLWVMNRKQVFWTAVSRAAVAPAIQGKGLMLPLQLGTIDGFNVTGTLEGNPNFKDESVIAYEAGFRRRMQHHVRLDVAGFVNRYQHISSLQSLPLQYVFSPPPPTIIVNQLYSNAFRDQSEGVEAALTWKPNSKLLLQGNYAWMQDNSTEIDPGNSQVDLWGTPRNTFAGTATWNFYPHWAATGFVYNVGPLETEQTFTAHAGGSGANAAAPGYTRLDLHVTRNVGHGLEVTAGGSNLLTPRHLEFGNGTDFVMPQYVPRSLFLTARWSFE